MVDIVDILLGRHITLMIEFTYKERAQTMAVGKLTSRSSSPQSKSWAADVLQKIIHPMEISLFGMSFSLIIHEKMDETNEG
jgi:hypothetical protein